MDTLADTKRPLNLCECGYTWYPRGKDLSLRCPRCGSEEVRFAEDLTPVEGSIHGGLVTFVIGIAVAGSIVSLFMMAHSIWQLHWGTAKFISDICNAFGGKTTPDQFLIRFGWSWLSVLWPVGLVPLGGFMGWMCVLRSRRRRAGLRQATPDPGPDEP